MGSELNFVRQQGFRDATPALAPGLMEAFETARAANQKAGAALLLRRIHLDEESIAAILGDS